MAYTPLPVAAGGVGGAVITTTPMQLTNSNARRYQRIFNAGPGQGKIAAPIVSALAPML